MVFGPDFRLVRSLPSVPELLISADNALLPTAHYCEPIDQTDRVRLRLITHPPHNYTPRPFSLVREDAGTGRGGASADRSRIDRY